MPLVPITIPPGLYMNGTYYDAKNRWHNANRVRWHNGSMRPIGGYLPVSDYLDVPVPPVSVDPILSVAGLGGEQIMKADIDELRRRWKSALGA